MTAEVAVLNRSAIAVAADSAVTRGPNKVHVSANKIFRISDKAPVGLMVYGNADVYGLPWELVAKLFRSTNATATYGSIEDWGRNFVSFLTDKRLLDEDAGERELVTLAYYLAEDLRKSCKGLQQRSLSRKLKAELDLWKASLQNADEIDNYTTPTPTIFSRNYGQMCRDILVDAFGGRGCTKEILANFPSVVRAFTKSKAMSDYMSGFIVFGFGDDEICPGFAHYFIDCAPYGKPRIILDEEFHVGRNPSDSCSVYSFASHNIATLFMEEVSATVKTFFRKSIRLSLEAFGEKIFDEFERSGKIKGDEKKVFNHLFQREIGEFSNKYDQEVASYLYNYSIEPILYALDGLAKEDMARLAESLVEIAALKLKVSGKTEVVGGPIDVAILSKYDGFIWVKRKHYFEEKYNAHFFSKYPRFK